MLPRSSSDILASAKRATKRSWSSSQDPFASDPRFSMFHSTEVQEAAGSSILSAASGSNEPIPTPTASETIQSQPQTYSSTYHFVPAVTQDTFLEERMARSQGSARREREMDHEPSGSMEVFICSDDEDHISYT
ncbi:hypothetical protein CPC08DRAFT_112438 [Agrocybe pediades]|nr:hypothetical protein CPC08DRAFT_112438 [Agrocybe pediades]